MLLANSSAYAFNIRDIFYNTGVLRPGYAGPQNLSSIYNPIIRLIFIIGGLVAFAGLLYGGFCYIMGAGQGDQKQIETGKKAITWSFLGLVLLISVYWFVQIIELVTGLNILNPTL